MVADYALIDQQGKLSVLGIFQHVWLSNFPAVYPRTHLVLRVRGRRIETTAARTDFANDESRDRFQRTLERMGIDAELRRLGARSGTMVRIGSVELEWGDED